MKIICKIFFCACLLITFSNLNAQIPAWQWANNIYGQSSLGGSQDVIESVATDPWGNVYVCGHTSGKILILGNDILKFDSIKYGHWDGFLLKYNKDGKLIWSYSIIGEESDYCNDVATDAKGNVYLTGSFISKKIVFGKTILTCKSEHACMFLAKFDPDGNILWAKQSDGKNKEEDDIGLALTVDIFGNIYSLVTFYGSTIDLGAGEIKNTGKRDAIIVKYNSNGNVLWTKSFSSIEYDEFRDIVVDKKCNVYIVGASPATKFGSTQIVNKGRSDIIIAKFNRDGHNLWVKNFGGQRDNFVPEIVVDLNENFYISGYFDDYEFDLGSVKIYSSQWLSSHAYIAMFDSDGQVKWVRDFAAGGQTYNNAATSMSLDSKGNIFLSGSFQNSFLKLDSLTIAKSSDSGKNDLFIIKFNANGEAKWAKTAKSTENIMPSKILVDASDNILIAGNHTAELTSFDNIILLSPLDEYKMHNSFIAKIGNTNTFKGIEDFKIYPNPSNGIFNLKNISEETHISIYDCQGKHIFSNKGDNTQINIESVRSGMYVLKLLNEGRISYHKIIIQ